MKLNEQVFLKIMWFGADYEWNLSRPWFEPHIPNIMISDPLVYINHINSIYILNLASLVELLLYLIHVYISFEGVFNKILADANLNLAIKLSLSVLPSIYHKSNRY